VEDIEALKKIAAEAQFLVDAFDQADTGSAIRTYNTFSTPERRKILVGAIDDLRAALRGTEYASTLAIIGEDGRPGVDYENQGVAKEHIKTTWSEA
jgi:hypothetical protein